MKHNLKMPSAIALVLQKTHTLPHAAASLLDDVARRFRLVEHKGPLLLCRNAIGATSPAPDVALVIAAAGAAADDAHWLVVDSRRRWPGCFVVVVSRALAESPTQRWRLTADGLANMVSGSPAAINDALGKIESAARGSELGGPKQLACPLCPVKLAREDDLWHHVPLYHINANKLEAQCPICKTEHRNIQRHIHYNHGPCGRGEIPRDDKAPVPELYAYALVACFRPDTGKMLLVQEHASVGYWLPGGHVDCGESLSAGAKRECLEEAGVAIKLTGILTMDYLSDPRGFVQLRVTFLAEPKSLDDCEPKTLPDFESVGAVWIDPEQVQSVPLRGREPLHAIQHMRSKKPVAPLSMLQER